MIFPDFPGRVGTLAFIFNVDKIKIQAVSFLYSMSQLLISTLRKRVTLLHTDGSFTPEIYYTIEILFHGVNRNHNSSRNKNAFQ